MKLRTLSIALLFALLVLLPAGAAAGDPLPPGPTTRHQAKTAGINPTNQFEIIHLILDFAPGAWTPAHSHGGQGLVTVLGGQITVREGGKEQVYKTGESWVELPGNVAEVGNAGTAPASVFVTFLLPQGAQLTTVRDQGTQQPPPGPTTRYQARTAGIPLSGPFEVIQLVLDFAAGAWTPPHSHGGQGLVTVLDGEMTVKETGQEQVYKAGETWVEQAGHVVTVGNATAAKASVAVTFLLPQGAPLTTIAMPGLPATGAGGMARQDLSWWIVGALGGGLAATAWSLRRRYAVR